MTHYVSERDIMQACENGCAYAMAHADVTSTVEFIAMPANYPPKAAILGELQDVARRQRELDAELAARAAT
jgi:hypothetical protein